MSRVYVRHTVTGATREVAQSAVPVLVQSGWLPLDDTEVAALHEQERADREAAWAAMAPARPAEPTARETFTQVAMKVESATARLDELDPAAPAGAGGEHDTPAPKVRRRQDTDKESD